MLTEKEIIIIQKATIYDLLKILKKDMDKQYTVAELENLLDVYITGLEQ